jgi:hypothetical protein
MVFGEPMYFSGDSSDLQFLRKVTDEIMDAIHGLSGQEYVDMYASEAKALIADAARERIKQELRAKKAAKKKPGSK